MLFLNEPELLGKAAPISNVADAAAFYLLICINLRPSASPSHHSHQVFPIGTKGNQEAVVKLPYIFLNYFYYHIVIHSKYGNIGRGEL
jgi:hypothetical protein